MFLVSLTLSRLFRLSFPFEADEVTQQPTVVARAFRRSPGGSPRILPNFGICLSVYLSSLFGMDELDTPFVKAPFVKARGEDLLEFYPTLLSSKCLTVFTLRGGSSRILPNFATV
ncbi:unnamed protein product [Dovyalis caffra]|uniref:Uncharacterized protein n=1 Tax=Dovyalis caffra TaxID=77055 RepID=A0AAV1SNB7_9ROSI|nr:unnamed protein product [Dovyalis caffra]